MQRVTAGRVIGSLARGVRGWWGNLAGSWKFTILATLIFPPAWHLNERRKAKEKQLFYNKSIDEKVFMDIAVNDRYVGRILIGLYNQQTPLTSENFIQLCEGYKVRDKIIGYKNTEIHRVFPGLGMIGGDVITGTGTKQLSIYGPKFPDENFDMEFIQDGDVSMCNTGPHSNSSQFLITFSPLPIFHQHNVVVGTVLKGMKIVRMIENLGTRVGKPMEKIRIINCGLYRGPEDGPPFFTVPELFDQHAEKLSEEEFTKLPAEEKEKLLGKKGEAGNGIRDERAKNENHKIFEKQETYQIPNLSPPPPPPSFEQPCTSPPQHSCAALISSSIEEQ